MTPLHSVLHTNLVDRLHEIFEHDYDNFITVNKQKGEIARCFAERRRTLLPYSTDGRMLRPSVQEYMVEK